MPFRTTMSLSSEDDAYYSDFFVYKNGHLFCEEAMVEDIRISLKKQYFPPSPFFLYSKAQIIKNVNAYKNALTTRKFSSVLNFSMKANPNTSILKELREQGCSLTLVSGMELKVALELQFEPSKLVFNGNGKMEYEIESAVRNNVLLNVDSLFNLRQTISVCRNLGTTSRVLIRVNPNIQTNVHMYNQTSTSNSKFGVDNKEMDAVLDKLKDTQEIELVGLHCHLGSTIDNTHVYRQSVRSLMSTFRDLQNKGFSSMKYLNIGGGLGIPYTKHVNRTRAYRSTDKTCLEDLQGILNNIEDEEERCTLSESFSEFKNERISYHHLISDFKNKREFGFIANCANSSSKPDLPGPHDLVTAISDLVDKDVTVILEPGRSLVGNAGVLICSVLGCSQTTTKNFVNVDGAMTEVIRPSFYGAYHHIDLIDLSVATPCHVFDVVGPVCESGDFLGKDRLLKTPKENSGLAVFDTGAYCSSMASNYNLRLRPTEVMVDGSKWSVIRKPDKYEDLIRPYMDL